MNYSSLLVFILVWSVCVEVDSRAIIVNYNVEGYYWRDYTSEIPKDAFSAGMDKEGNAVYICQVLHQSSLIPGEIKKAEKICYYNFEGNVHTATTSMKIFCTGRPEQFEWVSVTNGKFEDLKGRKIILGGIQDGFTVYIGRLISEGDIRVGKGLTRLKDGVTDMQDKKGVWQQSFEVLSYSPESAFRVTNGSFKYPEMLALRSKSECATRVVNINIS